VRPLSFDRLAAALAFLAIFTTACLMPAQSDTWWHLREGELLWSGGAPLTDHFSYTAGGYWQDREWLSQVLFFLIYRAGGLPLLTLVLASLVAGAWTLVWPLLEGPVLTRVLVMGLGVAATGMQWSLRPQLFSFAFLIATAFLMASDVLWPIPLLFLVWANLHAGVLVGLPLLVVMTCWSGRTQSRRRFVTVLLVTIAAFIATLVTPIGTGLWTSTWDAAQRMRLAGVEEFRPVSVTDIRMLPFTVLIAALILLVARARPWRPQSPARTLTVLNALAVAPIGFLAERNTALVAPLLVPAVCVLASREGLALLPSRAPGMRPLLNAITLAVAALLASATVGYSWTLRQADLGWTPVSRQLAASVSSCGTRIYNTFEQGGYLIWFVRNQKVFIDNRFDPYPADFLRDYEHVEASGDYRELFTRFNIDCAVVRRGSPVATRLSGDGWRTVFDENAWMVLRN
jgi:hypothetical protein